MYFSFDVGIQFSQINTNSHLTILLWHNNHWGTPVCGFINFPDDPYLEHSVNFLFGFGQER